MQKLRVCVTYTCQRPSQNDAVRVRAECVSFFFFSPPLQARFPIFRNRARIARNVLLQVRVRRSVLYNFARGEALPAKSLESDIREKGVTALGSSAYNWAKSRARDATAERIPSITVGTLVVVRARIHLKIDKLKSKKAIRVFPLLNFFSGSSPFKSQATMISLRGMTEPRAR